MSRKSTSRPIHKVETADLKAFLTPPLCSPGSPQTVNSGEEIPLPDTTRERSLTPKEAEQALRDLFHGDNNSASDTFADDGDVRGFREGFRLMPHQVPSRAWMRDREDSTKKKAGGILADEMGMGKTIQAAARILDGPPTKKDREDGWATAALVVCPLAVMQQWNTEIEKFTVGLKVMQYHDSKRGKIVAFLPDANIVLTTYGIVCSEHSTVNPHDRTQGSVLFSTKWWRIILGDYEHLFSVAWLTIVDEAHTIKNRKTKTAEACFDLQAKFRWCLTATPIYVNKVDEFFPLFKFLHIKPLNDWDQFNALIAKPISKGTGANLALKRLHVVLTHVMFRRTKAEVASELKLPKRSVVILPCKFDPSEQQFYIALKTKMDTVLKRILAQTEGSTYMNVLHLILRLRQACDHPCLALKSYESDEMEDLDLEDDDDGKPKCQLCRTRLTRRNTADKAWPDHCINCAALKVQSQNLQNPKRASAKIRAIIRLLQHIARESGGQEKTVIFSQFTAMLDIIESFLMATGIGFVRYDGQMSAKERTQALADISQDPVKTVILVSLRAGGVGLNLTACSRVILVDMWWNPAVEEQAFDRTHRVGQTRDVHIYKLKIDDTVEDRILELQEKKRQLTKMALDGDKIKNKQLGMAELLQLFK
ncbi:SNF2 family N-terminal domain-containing protein [Mycena galopus ATCC 62051]|nr:SNF2 family N-terminal domain-containing protein [Mycena galopus ATCC 62051]